MRPQCQHVEQWGSVTAWGTRHDLEAHMVTPTPVHHAYRVEHTCQGKDCVEGLREGKTHLVFKS